MLMKKNSYSLDIDQRSQKTNQLSGDDKVARITEAENYALSVYEADESLKEFLGPRADDSVAKTAMYKQIMTEGYCKLEDLPNDVANKYTLNTVDTYLIGAGIMSDLVTSTLELVRTQDEKRRIKSSTERAAEKAIESD